MARNNSFARETPLHLAARYGHLDTVPKEFLTKETLTASTEYERKESKTGPTPPRTETPLHYAVRYGHADQIPKEFLTPEFLSIEASGYRLTVLHQLAYAKQLDLVPEIHANSEMWNLKDSQGRTPREILESEIERESYVAGVRAEPATEKQKEKLRFFGYVLKAGMTKGEASDALNECARQLPHKNAEYYNRPATVEQLTELQNINAQCEPDEPFYDFEEGPLTYGKAKDVLQEWVWHQREKEREEESAYLESDESRIDEAWMRIEDSLEVTRDEVAKAWAVAKSHMADKSESPDLDEIEDTLEELFPHIRKQTEYRGVYRCKDCAVMFKVRLPKINAANMSLPFCSKDDLIEVTIPCPGCGRDKMVNSLKICKYTCPHCSKECLVAKSQTGKEVTHFKCSKNFFATPTELSKVEQRVRLMNYSE